MLVSLSSGNGASGIAASLSYAALSGIGFTPKTTLLLVLVVPLAEIVAFFFVQESNAITSDSMSTTALVDENGPTIESFTMTFSEKWRYLPKLIKYFIPLLILCLCQYIINQMVSSTSQHRIF